jgi:hypothetical protein
MVSSFLMADGGPKRASWEMIQTSRIYASNKTDIVDNVGYN